MEEVAQDLKRKGLVDVHCHLLPGVDDGPTDRAESVRMARILSDAGFSEIWCTPHLIKGFHEAPSAEVRAAVASLQRSIEAAGIELTLRPGREYRLDEFLPALLEDPLPIDGTHLLVEPPFQGNPAIFPQAIHPVIRKGFTPLIAHPERCAALDPEDGIVERLRQMGCAFQLNIGSFAGIYGERVRRNAYRYVRSRLTSIVGTDAHSHVDLSAWVPKGMSEVERAGGARFGFRAADRSTAATGGSIR